jgi:ribosomal protein S18 acetylase RimI-like enzyme
MLSGDAPFITETRRTSRRTYWLAFTSLEGTNSQTRRLQLHLRYSSFIDIHNQLRIERINKSQQHPPKQATKHAQFQREYAIRKRISRTPHTNYSVEQPRNPLKRLSTNLVSSQPSKRTKQRSPSNPAKEQLKAANALSLLEFVKRYFPKTPELYTAKNRLEYTVTPQTSTSLSEVDLMRCFNLIEETSSADYRASSSGWDPTYKKEEMKEVDMRYILVRRSTSLSELVSEESTNAGKDIIAFMSFMLTMEENEAVIYIYEVHSDTSARGIGLGKFLMQLVEDIGRNAGVVKSMLTVFTRNIHAEAFYKRMGYIEDASCPPARKLRGGKVKKPEYLILSKELPEERIDDGAEVKS